MTDLRPAPTPERAVAPLAAFGREDLPAVGGKAANLGELIRAGLPVPDGFAVTTAAYARVAAHNGLDDLARAGAPDAAARLRDGFARAEIPDDLRQDLLDAYAALGGGPVAVRSSATAEDLPGAAFAGQQDTFLNVAGEAALLDAVRRCWGSLWTDRAVAYRRRIGIDPAGVRIAVAVQVMAAANWAGVLFTAHPVTGDRERLVVEAGRGLGEAVVSGLVTPEHYELDPAGAVLEHVAGRGEVVVGAVEGGGVAHREGGPAGGPPAALLAELVRLGRAVAEHYARPMDVEWASAGDRVLLLQARPMTAVPPEPLRLDPIQRRVAPILLDMFQGRPYPLDVTTWTGALLGMVAEMLHGLAGARFPPVGAVLPERDGVVTRFVPPSPRPTALTPARPFQLYARSRRFDPARWTEDPRFAAFERDLAGLAARPATDLDWVELRRRPAAVLALLPGMTALRVDYLAGWVVPMAQLRLLLAVLHRGADLGDLMFGAVTRTEDANRGLEALAGRVRDDRELAGAFAARTPGELAAALDEHPGFAAAFRGFLTEYGHRETLSALYVSAPTWRDSPETVLSLVQLLASDPPAARPDRAGKALDRLLGHPLLRSERARRRVRRLVGRVREGMKLREDTHFHFTRLLPPLRDALLEIGHRLAGDGVLDVPDDVFHLRLDELEGIERLPGLTPERRARLRATVTRRAAAREELAGVPMLNLHALGATRTVPGDALVAGTPACGGRAEGPVRVIRSADEFDRMRSGDVLVCPYTNPSWTPLFQRAAAVVADAGGVGSHAAIVAREYGIPAIMGTGRGTAVLADGLRVRVDGDTGTVRPA
ncbi:phosphoenolpyruvate synthase [Pseudonocardia sp. C8]|uniref:PEP/pyruvate-binding domain-containing protein n=1 Tax=Pseudonocardia sp. C8 TaxID=2762759 RepID=UPI001642EDA6|nr:PEP/pyruvate-binding domain-containing protein [Pseudonocardia sp. C8]MBC3194130.1 phosphoenolpyruvate synthase [Pseudonocardia sp. C8]